MRWGLVHQGGFAGSAITTRGLARALERCGHDVCVFSWDRPEHLFLEHADILIVEGVNPRFAAWPSLGRYRVIYWCLSFGGDPAIAYALPEKLHRYGFAGVMTNAPGYADYLRRFGIPATFSLLAADPEEFCLVAPESVPEAMRADAVYVGCWPHKDEAQERIIIGGASETALAVYGIGWERSPYAVVHRGALSHGAVALAYAGARCVLGMVEQVQAAFGCWNNRLFEALACNRPLIVPPFAPSTPEEIEPFVLRSVSPYETAAHVRSVVGPVRSRSAILAGHTWDHRVPAWVALAEEVLAK